VREERERERDEGLDGCWRDGKLAGGKREIEREEGMDGEREEGRVRRRELEMDANHV
jgi:hypothetical protein